MKKIKTKGEMSEENLQKVTRIFFNKSEIQTQIRYKFEYNGFHHYCNI
jgi:hypothetical protein